MLTGLIFSFQVIFFSPFFHLTVNFNDTIYLDNVSLLFLNMNVTKTCRVIIGSKLAAKA